MPGDTAGTGGRLLVIGPDHRTAPRHEQPGLDAEAATRLLVNRLLHAPAGVLRGLATSDAGKAEVGVLARRLFRLDSDKGDEGP